MNSMDRPDYLISTPENVDLHLELAGLGNRIIAALVDSLAIGAIDCLVLTVLVILAMAVEASGGSTEVKNAVYFWSICISIFVMFIVSFGYFAIFEGIWQGQTPGKKVAGIRVIDNTGQPVGWGAVLIRNFVRMFDGISYIGILPMILDKNERRFGDLCAGTIVIRERLQSLGSSELKILGNPANETVMDTGQISPDEYNLIVSFLKRREQMGRMERDRLASEIARHFRESLSVFDVSDQPERFIEKVFIAYKRRAELLAE